MVELCGGKPGQASSPAAHPQCAQGAPLGSMETAVSRFHDEFIYREVTGLSGSGRIRW